MSLLLIRRIRLIEEDAKRGIGRWLRCRSVSKKGSTAAVVV